MSELDRLRERFGLFVVGLLWLLVPIISLVALGLHRPVASPVAIAVLLATAYHLTWWRFATAPVTRYLSAVALMGEPALLVYLLAGHPWQMDMHMFFFATLALTIAWYDWRVILVAAVVVVFHHVILDFVLPSAVFPDGSYLTRVVLHGSIVAIQAAVLIWLSNRMVESFERVNVMSAELGHSNDLLEAKIRDRTADLLETTELLQRSTAQMAAIIDAAPVPITAIDSDFRITIWNPAAEAMFGYTRSEVIGGPVPAAVHIDSEEIYERFKGAGAGEILSGLELKLRRKDGRVVETIVSGSAFFDKAGRRQGSISAFTDMTELNAVHNRLRQSQKMEAIGQLTGGIAHDFNNLLGVVLGNLDILEEAQEPGSDAHLLTHAAIRAAVRGAELTKQLLAYSRQQPLAPKLTDLSNILGDATRLLGRVLGEDVKLELKIAKDLWPVLIDAPQLEAAILNLALNARDAMPQGGVLTLEARNVRVEQGQDEENLELAAGSYVDFAVSDNGSGMANDVIAKACEPFFSTKGPSASGLGLSMVQGFVKQSGGRTAIYSELGIGTTVRMYLPRAEASEPAPAATERSSAYAASKVVLIVEDNAELREAATRQLQTLGYGTVAARNGAEALEVLESDTRVDLLFTDVVMPGGLNGRVLAEMARNLRPDLRVLFTSGFAGVAVEGGPFAADLLQKPYRKDGLARRVRHAFDHPAGTIA